MKKAGAIRNIVWYLVGALLCLTMVSLHFVSGLYAKYVTSDSVSDNARTASFYLEAEGPLSRHFRLELIPGDSFHQKLEVVNRSEVTMEYTLVIRNETGNLPLTYVFQKDGDPTPYVPVNGAYTIEKTLDPGEQGDTFYLDITWPVDVDPVDSNLAYMGMLDYISIKINATQVD